MKRFLLVILLIYMLIVSGCNNPTENENHTQIDLNISDINGFSLDSYNIETDDQVFFTESHEMILCEEGYYYFIGEILNFFDKNSKQSVPVCTKPDCNHASDDLECNAHFSYEQYYINNGIYYYNSNLYILANDGTDNTKSLFLYKISKDGSSRHQVCHITDFGSDVESMLMKFIIHKGKGYLSYSSEEKAELYSFDIEDGSPILNKIDEIKGIGAEIYRLQGCDEGISYQYGCFTDDSLEDFEGGIKISIDGISKVVVKDAIKPYVIANGNVYYETAEGIKIYSVKTEEISEFTAVSEDYSLNYDGKYFYAYNCINDIQQSIYVYDEDQNNISKLEMPNDAIFVSLVFGDENLFFFTYGDKDENSYLCYFDKSKIGQGENNWKTVYTISKSGEVTFNG